MGELRARAYDDGRLVASDFELAAVSDHLGTNCVVWVDLLEPTKEELHELAAELGLHELAVEDALSVHQRPKLDHYPTHLFLSCHAVRVDPAAGELVEAEIDAFIGPNFLVTVRKSDGFALDGVMARWDRSPDLAGHGTSYLLYGLLDVVVDGYFTAVESFDEFYDDVSESIFDGEPLGPDQQRTWFRMRRALVRFHRLVVPMREAVSGLMRREHAAVSEELYPYFQDVYDHILRVSESTDSLRDLVTSIVETNISLRDYRQNQIMKKVTSWAAIVAVPTLITGFYGMNLPFPGEGTHWGVALAVALIVVLSVSLYWTFRRRDWL